jgi:hypothetical protein
MEKLFNENVFSVGNQRLQRAISGLEKGRSANIMVVINVVPFFFANCAMRACWRY